MENISSIKSSEKKSEKIKWPPEYYSINRQIIPFCDATYPDLRQVVKCKPRSIEIIVFVAIRGDGILNYEVYICTKTVFTDKSLSVDPSAILHLSKTSPSDDGLKKNCMTKKQ